MSFNLYIRRVQYLALATVISASALVGFMLFGYRMQMYNFTVVAAPKHASGNLGQLENNWVETAANSTLGFGSIEYINMRSGFDRAATLVMQAEVAGLKLTRNEAVLTNEIHDNGKGVPPSNRHKLLPPLPPSVKACTLSHMNIWEKLISSDLQTMFVLESDAMWSKNVRENNKLIAEGLHKLREKMANASLPNPSPQDPFNSSSWDILNFGACTDRSLNKDNYVVISDPEAVDVKYFDLDLHRQRVIRQTGSMSCTTAYAVSRKGAMKMLLRAAINFDKEVDIMINDMITKQKLVAYGPYPVPIIQWKYKRGIGADDLNSDIDDRKVIPTTVNAHQLWNTVMKDESVWEPEERYPDISNDALSAIGSYISSM